MGRVGDGGPQEGKARDASCNTFKKVWFVPSQACQPALSLSTSLAATTAKTASQFNTCCCYYSLIQQNVGPFCCHHIPFPCDREVFSCLLLLLEQLRSDPQYPHAVTRIKTSVDLQILNRDNSFPNVFGCGVRIL